MTASEEVSIEKAHAAWLEGARNILSQDGDSKQIMCALILHCEGWYNRVDGAKLAVEIFRAIFKIKMEESP